MKTLSPDMTAIAVRRPKTTIGWREWVALPELGIQRLKAKIDSGARTSALHATDIAVRHDGETMVVDFRVLTETGALRACTAPLEDERMIRNTSGQEEHRVVIRTLLSIAGRRWPIDVSLTDRGPMKFDLILGRTAVRRHGLLIDPGRSFLAGEPARPQ